MAELGTLHELATTTLLPSRPDADLDRFARLATVALGTPVGLVSMVSATGQVFPGCVGLPEPWQSERATPLTHSLCQHVVTSGRTFVVDDTREDPLTAGSLAIRDLDVVAYLGVPLISADRHALGSFCVIDSKPRLWTSEQVRLMQDLAASVVTELRAPAAA